jgi:hypothetical protein
VMHHGIHQGYDIRSQDDHPEPMTTLREIRDTMTVGKPPQQFDIAAAAGRKDPQGS